MSDPFRLRIMKALTACIEGVTTSNGYSHDLTGKVLRGRLFFGDNDPLPMVSIIEPPLPIDRLPAPAGASQSSGKWELMIQGWVEDDFENPTDPAYRLVADVKRVLTIEGARRDAKGQLDILGFGRPATVVENGREFSVGNVITSMKVGASVVRPPEDGISDKAYFWLHLYLEIIEDNARPLL